MLVRSDLFFIAIAFIVVGAILYYIPFLPYPIPIIIIVLGVIVLMVWLYYQVVSGRSG